MERLEFKIDNRSTVLEYVQIAQQIKKEIVNQSLLEKDIETPKIFSNKYKINIEIVDAAFEMLLNERVLKKNSKNKYYNAYEQRIYFTDKGVSSVEFIQSINMEPKVLIFSEEEITINQKESKKTKFDIGTKVIKQERIFYGNDIPIIYAIVYYRKEDRNLFNDIYISVSKSLGTKYTNLKNPRVIRSLTLPNNINKILNQPTKMIGITIAENISSEGVELYFGEFYYNRYYTIKIEF